MRCSGGLRTRRDNTLKTSVRMVALMGELLLNFSFRRPALKASDEQDDFTHSVSDSGLSLWLVGILHRYEERGLT